MATKKTIFAISFLSLSLSYIDNVSAITCQSMVYRVVDNQGNVTYEDIRPCEQAVDVEAGGSTKLFGITPSVVSATGPRVRKGLNPNGKSYFWLYLEYTTRRCRDPNAQAPCAWREVDDTPVKLQWWVVPQSGSHISKSGLRPPGILDVFRPRNKNEDSHISSYDTLETIGGNDATGLNESNDVVVYTGDGEEATTGESDRVPLKTKGSIRPPTNSDSPTLEHQTDEHGHLEIRYTTPEAAGTSVISVQLNPVGYDHSTIVLFIFDVAVSKDFISPGGYESENGARWVEKPAHQLPARCHGNDVFNGQRETFDAFDRAINEFGNLMITQHNVTSEAHTLITGETASPLEIPEIVVTDISLPWGGLSDLYSTKTLTGCDWTPPHFEHRHGRDMDIRINENINSQSRNLLEVSLRQFGFDFPVDRESPNNPSTDHWHIHLP